MKFYYYKWAKVILPRKNDLVAFSKLVAALVYSGILVGNWVATLISLIRHFRAIGNNM